MSGSGEITPGGSSSGSSGGMFGGQPAQQADNSMNPMAMLQAYRQGQSLQQVGKMNMPTARPAQYLPPAMAQYTPPAPAAPAPTQPAGLMGGFNDLPPEYDWMRNRDNHGGGA